MRSAAVTFRIQARAIENRVTCLNLQKQGYNCLRNRHTNELHDLRIDKFFGFHNLIRANLHHFDALIYIDETPINYLSEDTVMQVYDSETGQVTDTFRLNKCQFCFPKVVRRQTAPTPIKNRIARIGY